MLRLDGELGSRLMARAPRLLAGLLVVLIGVRASLLLVQLAGPPVASTLPVAAPAPIAPSVSRNTVDVPSILRANLFGQSVQVLDSKNAPITSMPLQLGGVVAASDPKRGFASIGTTPTDIKLYKVGTAVPGGATLFEVYVDRVLLDRGGSIESLPMPVRAGAVGGGSIRPPPLSSAAPVSAARVQQAIRDNPNMIRQIMSPTAVTENGKLVGMRVYPGANRAAFDKLGLKSGDLVTAINGVPLNDQTRAEQIFNSLSSTAEAQVTVTRNGAQQDLHLNLAEVANEAEKLAQTPATTGPAPPPGPESAR